MPEWIWHWSGYAVALLAFVGVVWALFWDRSRGRKRCRRCWYDLSGAVDLPADCPECGRAHTKPRHLTRTRRRWGRAVALGLVMVVGGYGLWVVPRVQERGWVGAVPTTALIAAAPILESLETTNPSSARPAWFSANSSGWDLRSRCYDMSPWLGGISFRWFSLWDTGVLGAHDDPKLLAWCREELVVQSNVPKAQLQRVVHRQVEKRLLDVSLVGRADTRGGRIWLSHPKHEARSGRVVIPRGWELDWRMLRDGEVSSRFTKTDGMGLWSVGGSPTDDADPLASFDPVWVEGDEVSYQVRIREPDLHVTKKWIVRFRAGVLPADMELDVQRWRAEPVAVASIDG